MMTFTGLSKQVCHEITACWESQKERQCVSGTRV